MAFAETFKALSDPVRREILNHNLDWLITFWCVHHM